jgi:c-di-GMP phosphodiesterase
MIDFFIGRQPIFDRHLRVYAYELLYRHANVDRAVITNAETASAEVLFNSLIEIGLDRLVGNHKAFCNFTRDFLIKIADLPFSNDQVVIEVLESVLPEPEVIDTIKTLSRRGHMIALDDFVVCEELIPLIKVADIIKIDVRTQSRAKVTGELSYLRQFKPLKFLAEKVESHEDYLFCRELDFDYFQGFFFSKPQIVSGQKLPHSRLAILNLLAELHQCEIDLNKLQKIIETDVNLSVKLLRLINSCFYSLPSKIKSIRHAIIFLGLLHIRNWACMVAIGSVDDKPRELMTMSLVRAKMCEMLCGTKDKDSKAMFFTVGLFSLLDTIFDMPMEKLLDYMPLTKEVNNALLYRQGIAGDALGCVEAYELGDWDFIEKSVFDSHLVSKAFLEALDWTYTVMMS